VRAKKTRTAATAPLKSPPPPDRRPSSFALRLEALGSSPLAFLLASIALLIPCFWQSRIQAGDLSSHIYNAWLAQLIQSGKTTGLAVVGQSTNILADLILSALLRALGPSAAQRITVSAAVLIFGWGAFAFITRVSVRRPWSLFPVIVFLAYGFTFQMGFLNFYLSLGLCFWALAAAWDFTPLGLATAAALLALAYTAHGLGVLWAAALLVYVWIARRLSDRARPRLAAACLAGIVLFRLILNSTTATMWVPLQLFNWTAADQAWVFDDKYIAPMVGMMLLWAVLWASLVRRQGARSLVQSVPVHLCVLTSAGILILPSAIAIPGYNHSLSFIANRMSLALGICFCAVLAAGRIPKVARVLAIAAPLLYFGMLYRDDAIVNSVEDRVTAAVAPLRGKRVVLGFDDLSPQVRPFTHIIDRACVGVCYSYANYEPSTAQFRVRALAPNPFVAATYLDAWTLQNGGYVVRPADVPIYRLDFAPDGRVVAREVPAGATLTIASLDLLN